MFDVIYFKFYFVVRTRIAPSPTGKDLHLGSVATALVNYAWAKKHHGQFIVRIEDTDRTRLVTGAEEKILSSLDRVGLSPDESPKKGGVYGPYRQSDRLAIYKKYAHQLIDSKKAYYCLCSPLRLEKMRKEQQQKKQIPKYDRYCYKHQQAVIKKIKKGEAHVIRLLIPEGETRFNDVIRGNISIKNENLDDQILLKSDGYPTYHLGVVVDDYLMKITDVIRGEEWLPSTPKHIILYQAFGWPLPVYAHLSLLRNPDKSKLSKRNNPVWTSWYLDQQGILPEALLNYLALMGWSHPQGKEIFDINEYIRVFNLKDIQKTAPIFDPVKLEWMNGEYIRKSQTSILISQIDNFYKKKLDRAVIEKTIPLVRERIKKLSDYLPLCEFFFTCPKSYEIELTHKKDFLAKVYLRLKKISDWRAAVIGNNMQELARQLALDNKVFFKDLRVAITGKKISPPLNESMEILGKEECLKRLKMLSV